MSAMNCSEFVSRMDDWLDGLPDVGSREHLRQCSDCRGLIEDLSTIQGAALSMAADDLDMEPSPRVWNSLRAQLQQEGLIRTVPRGRLAGVTGWLEALFEGAPRPALAGAYMVVLVALGFALGRPIDSRMNASNWERNTADSTNVLNAQLDSAEQSTVSSMAGDDAAVAASLHENLAIVNENISLCEQSVREEPENEAVRDYLYEAYQQKADLLAEISERGER